MTTLQGSFSQAFSANQAILQSLTKTLTDAVANPKGFDPKTLALMKSNVSDQVAASTRNAQVAAGNAMAARSGPELGSGVNAQIAGSIAGQGEEERAKELSGIDIQSGLLQNENYWKGIQGLTGVAEAYNPAGYASAANQAGSTTKGLADSVLASKQADWQNAFGVVKGVAGLASAAAGFKMPSFGGSSAGGATNSGGSVLTGGSDPGICWIAEALYGVDDYRTIAVRKYLKARGGIFVFLYRLVGRRVARINWMVQLLKPVFDRFVQKGLASIPAADINDYESIWYQR